MVSLRIIQMISLIAFLIITLWILFENFILDQRWFGSLVDITSISDERESGQHINNNISLVNISFNSFIGKHIDPWWFVNREQKHLFSKSTGNSTEKGIAILWPQRGVGDRIVEQLRFVPENLAETTINGTRLKKILLYNDIYGWPDGKARTGQFVFLHYKCPVNTCTITFSRKELPEVDAVIFKDISVNLKVERRPYHQVWIAYSLESPLNSKLSTPYKKVFNWTSTYRSDSDVPFVYSKFVLYDPLVKTLPLQKNFAANKTKKVAWVVSNCWPKNKRKQYATELSKYIDVDIFGHCGNKPCNRTNCMKVIGKEYKFMLAFENSNCREYITEKFFRNALSNDILPVVMGAPKEDYVKVGPHNSFIHVDDFESPLELASYLRILNENDTLYNEYFTWKGTGEFINDRYFCRLCAMLHDEPKTRVYDDFEKWFRGPGICRQASWKQKSIS